MDITSSFGQNWELTPQRALLFYTETQRYEGITTSEPSRALVTGHTIRVDDKGVAVIEAGQVIGIDEMHEYLQCFAVSAPRARTLIDERLLFADETRLLWWCPSARRAMRFSTADRKFNHEVSGKLALHPPLLFRAAPGKLSVFALPENARPKAQNPIMVAPYCNLYANGVMCSGSVPLPQTIDANALGANALGANALDEWERLYFESAFTHSNLVGELTRFPGGHNALWRAMVKPEAKEFPLETLLPLTKADGSRRKAITVEEVMNA